ncbi:arsenate reductase ArsC [Actinomadura sp. SCN-SB]|uniref:arsenate reductase ArsC n=1 Tax=Actinomadura sp. SCN-SB TaxID=3373092 RepID=UPI003750E0D8
MTDVHPSPDLSVDQRHALLTAARNLGRAFAGTFGTETIERFLHSSYDQFAIRATVPHYLPLLAERFTRQRLQALARIEGRDAGGTPIVLFLCVHNAGRSQMALGFLRHLAGDAAIGWSGGSEPGTEINPAAIAAMRERGIEISGEFPQPWTDEIVRAADVVVTMGCGDACPVFPGKRYEDWPVADPEGLGLEDVRPSGTSSNAASASSSTGSRSRSPGDQAAIGDPRRRETSLADLPCRAVPLRAQCLASAMAAALLSHHSGGVVTARAACPAPDAALPSAVVAAMTELGVDLADHPV